MNLLGVAAFLYIPYCIIASCEFIPIQELSYKGVNIQFCQYEDGVILPVGWNNVDMDTCMNCTCYDDGMSCCAFGFRAGAIYINDECTLKELPQCDYAIVRLDDEDVLC